MSSAVATAPELVTVTSTRPVEGPTVPKSHAVGVALSVVCGVGMPTPVSVAEAVLLLLPASIMVTVASRGPVPRGLKMKEIRQLDPADSGEVADMWSKHVLT